MKQNCLTCGEEFKTYPSVVKRGGGKFCSPKCYIPYASGIKKGSKNPNWHGGNKTKKCPTCGEFFEIFPNEKQTFCSRECAGPSVGENMRGVRHYNWKGGTVKKPCAVCGKIFITPKCEEQTRKHCSLACMGIAHRQENNNSWRGGRTPYLRLVRTLGKYWVWRDGVFKRDGHTCQKCPTKDVLKLRAHHIKRLDTIVKEILRDSPSMHFIDAAKKNKDLWDISNGITLCVLCHKKEHKNAL